MAELPPGNSELVLSKSGEGRLHYLTAYRYRLPGNPPGRLQGLRVTRTVRPANQAEVLYQQGLSPIADALIPRRWARCMILAWKSSPTIPSTMWSLPTRSPPDWKRSIRRSRPAPPTFQPQQDSWAIGYQQLGRARILAYSNRLDPGVYSLHYLVRSVTPGTFLWPGSQVQLEHAPEEFGRAATATLEIQE
jgi:hypothetical protein